MASSTTTPGVEPSRARGATSAIGFGSLMRAVRRYSLLMFVFVLLAAAAGALVYFFLPLPRMTAQMIFFVNQNPQYRLTPGLFQDRDPATFRTYQANLFKNRFVLNAVMAEPGIAGLSVFELDKIQEPIEYLRANLRIEFNLGPEHMRVSLEGNDQTELLAILNAVKTAYVKRVLFDETQARSVKMESMKRMQGQYSADLKNFRQKIRNVLTTNGSTDTLSMAIQERFLNSQIGTIDSELGRLNGRERDLTLQLNRIESEMKLPPTMRRTIPPELVEQYVLADPQLLGMQKKLSELNAKLVLFHDTVPEKGPKPQSMLGLEKDIAEVEMDMKKHAEKIRPAIAAALKDQLMKGEVALKASVSGQLELVKEQKQQVMKELKTVIEQLNGMKSANAAVEDLRSEIANFESITNKINNEIVAMTPELDAPPRVHMWEEPYAFYGTEGNRRVKYTAMAVIAFLVLGLIMAQWLELRHRRIQTLDEITHGLGLQVLGTVPAMPKGGVNAGSNWPHLLTEAVNTTRTMLLSGPNASTNKTLLVTSAMSGEGKTSLTTHLAVSLANAGRRVMLIDADMRRPAVHRVLGLSSKPGLAELLIGLNQLSDVVQQCKIPNLHLLPAGTWSREAAAALSSDNWPRVLHEASQGFDFVLVDSPPILPVADALAIARNVDGVLISVMQDQSRYGAVQTACQRLNMVGAKVLGVVVSGMKSVGGYYYYYYYDERYSKPNAHAAANPEPPVPVDATAATPPTAN